ncbi:hypothetical protein JCM6882_004524 [Rhodosporidiobolus microsporus]
MPRKTKARSPSPSPSAPEEPEERFHFPSVRLNEALVDSYTFHSVDDERASGTGKDNGKGKGKERADGGAEDGDEEMQDQDQEDQQVVEGEWMLGVDEAGRGPALGPQVYGIAFCKLSYADELKSLGFADSKTLTDPIREELFKVIIDHGEDVKYAVRVMSPNDISMGMLRRTPYNLNAQSHDATINLIREVVEKGYQVKEAYVDTVGPAADYQAKLSALFPTISFTVTSKADALFPVVSAASIVAKITRDRILEDWTFAEPGVGGEGEEGEEGEEARLFGSGYPSDPKTVAWLQDNFDPIFGFPNVARFSWAPVRNALQKKGAACKWDDEPASIQKYFSGQPAGADRAPLWKDFNLVSVGEF